MHPVHYSVSIETLHGEMPQIFVPYLMQASTANAGTMMTTAGQVIATSTGNFPQQMLPGLVPTNANKILLFGQCEAAATQQSLSNFRPKVVARSQKQKTRTFQNQLPVLQPSSLYGSIVPVHSSQILNGYHIREISSQPQIITTQASGTVLNQAQLLGLQTVNALPPGLTWAPSGLHHCQNPFIIYNQPSGMTVHQVQPQMAMHLPIAAAALPIPTTTSAVVAPRMQKYSHLMPKVKIVKEPSYIGEQNQLPSTPVAQLKSVAGNQLKSTNPNLVHIVNDQTKSTGIESKSVSVETKISSPQRSQATVVPFSEILQASVAPIQTVDVSVISMTPSTLTIGSCAGENPSPSNTEMVTIDAEINQTPSTSITLSDTGIETYPNPVQVVNDLTKFTGVESKTASVETKISSPQKSQASITPFSKTLQACIASTVNVSVVSVTPSSLTTGSCTDASPSPSSIQRATTHAEMNQEPSTPVAQQNSDACNEICSNLVQSVSDLAKSTGNESMSVPAETNISSHQKSQAMFLQACVVPKTPTVDVSVASSTMSPMTTSSVVSTFSVPTVSPVSPVPCLTNRVLSDFNSKPSLPKAHNKALVTSHQTNTTETMVTDEPLKHRQLIQELSLQPVKDKQPLTATVKPQVLNHIINGFIIQESSEPFPVSQSPLLDSPCRVFPPKKLNLPEERENSLTVPNPENKVRALRPRGNVELVKCEFCRKLGLKFRFSHSKRFCSKSCAKQFNKHTSKRVERLVPAIQGHVGSGGRGRKRKRFRGRKRLQKQLLVEDESTNATPAEETLPASENELVVSCKTDEENSAPFDNSHHTPMEVDKSSDEVELLKSDLSQKSPSKWTVQDVFEFIQNLPGYSDYADNFKSQEVDGQALLLLNEDHLKTAMCMKLGPAIKLLSQIRSIEEKLQL